MAPMPERESGIQRRSFEAVLRMETKGGAPRLEGHAAVFLVETVIAGLFRERMMPGAFTRAIGEDDVRSCFNHDFSQLLGRNRAGTLELAEDQTGLWFGVDMPDTQVAHDLGESVARGDVDQCSIMFGIGAETMENFDDELTRFSITEVRPLYEAGPVTFAQYPETDVGLASAQLRLARALEHEAGGRRLPDGEGAARARGSLRARAATLAGRYNQDDRPFIRAAFSQGEKG